MYTNQSKHVSITPQDRQFTFEGFTENKSVFVAGFLIIWVLEQLPLKKGNPKAYPMIEFELCFIVFTLTCSHNNTQKNLF